MGNRDLQSTGEIAREVGVPLYNVDWAIKSLGIKPVKKVGMMGVRLFSPAQVRKIVGEINRIKQSREKATA